MFRPRHPSGRLCGRDAPLTLIVVLVVLDRRATVLTGGCASRDVVDFDGVVVLEIVDVVDATAGLFLDGATRLVLLLLPLLAAQATRWRGRTEVCGSIARGARRTPRTRTKRTATTTKAATAETAAEAATGRPRTWRPAWPGSAETGRTARGTGRSIFARARFADREISSLKRLRVEFPDDLFGHGAVGELDEGKPPRSAGLAIDRHHNVRRFGDGREVGPEICFRRAVWQVADEQPDSQGSPERRSDCIPGGRNSCTHRRQDESGTRFVV